MLVHSPWSVVRSEEVFGGLRLRVGGRLSWTTDYRLRTTDYP